MKKIRAGFVLGILLLFLSACGTPETDKIPGNTDVVTEVTQTPEATESIPSPTPLPLVELTYDFNDMYCYEAYNLAGSIGEDGAVNLRFGRQDGVIVFMLPQPIDLTECAYVTVNAKSENGEIIFKIHNDRILDSIWATEVAAKHGIKSESKQEYKCYALPGNMAYAVCILPKDDPQQLENYQATVYDVTFHMKPGYELPEKETVMKEDEVTLKSTYGTVFEHVGTEACCEDLFSETALNFIKKHYNTVVTGLEAKQTKLLAYNYQGSPILIPTEEARELGYIIPDNYKEETVPALNFGVLDSIMRVCAENDLYFRFHTLIWHETGISWFHRNEYAIDGGFVSEEVMDARFEYYITNVVTHLCESKYREILCGMDVINEYPHNDNDVTWAEVYGDPTEQPEFVKKAFECADGILRKYGMREQVALVFNDYNTFTNTTGLINMIKYINSDGKICDGIGMQSHMRTNYPYSTMQYRDALNAFANAGFEIHITEMDICISDGHTESDLAERYYEIMMYLLEAKKAGANITQLLWWGHADDTSWLKESTPLMFSKVDEPKEAYYAVLQAYLDAGFKAE